MIRETNTFLTDLKDCNELPDIFFHEVKVLLYYFRTRFSALDFLFEQKNGWDGRLVEMMIQDSLQIFSSHFFQKVRSSKQYKTYNEIDLKESSPCFKNLCQNISIKLSGWFRENSGKKKKGEILKENILEIRLAIEILILDLEKFIEDLELKRKTETFVSRYAVV